MGKNIIEVKNIKTGEVLEFQSQYALARYFTDIYDIESSSKNVGRLAKQKKPYRKTWKIQFKGEDNGEISAK